MSVNKCLACFWLCMCLCTACAGGNNTVRGVKPDPGEGSTAILEDSSGGGMDPGSGQTGAMRPSVLPLPLVDPGSGQTGAFSGNSNNDAEKESQNPSGQGAAVDIDQEEIAARIKDTMGDSGMEWIRNMDGCKNPAYGYAFIELAVKPGEEQQASAWIEGKCGKGDDASLKKTPMFTNRICDSMRAKRMLLAYTYFTQGSGGAKTKSVTVYTAETEEGMYVYLLRI